MLSFGTELIWQNDSCVEVSKTRSHELRAESITEGIIRFVWDPFSPNHRRLDRLRSRLWLCECVEKVGSDFSVVKMNILTVEHIRHKKTRLWDEWVGTQKTRLGPGLLKEKNDIPCSPVVFAIVPAYAIGVVLELIRDRQNTGHQSIPSELLEPVSFC